MNIGRVVFEICERTDRQTNRQTYGHADCNESLSRPYRGQSEMRLQGRRLALGAATCRASCISQAPACRSDGFDRRPFNKTTTYTPRQRLISRYSTPLEATISCGWSWVQAADVGLVLMTYERPMKLSRSSAIDASAKMCRSLCHIH